MSNNNENMFVEASRSKLRFVTKNGHLTSEDLWDLSLKSLDEIAVRTHEDIQPQGKSFLANPDAKVKKENEENQLRLDILKFVIETKQDENSEKLKRSKNKAQLEFLEDLKAKKKLADLESMTAEEIDAQIAALKG